MKKIILILLLIFITSETRSQDCGGVEKWDIKICTDSRASQINWQDTIVTTIAEQRAFNPVKRKKNITRADNEMQLYKIEAWLVGAKVEGDKDYHLVIADDNGKTMIVEIPNPECPDIQNSICLESIKKVFEWCTDNLKPKAKYKKFKKKNKYIFIGIGFSDFLHGQTGVAPSGRELHPCVNIQIIK